MLKGKKIIAAVSALVLAMTSFAAMTVSAAGYSVGTATVPTVVADVTTGASTNKGDTVKVDIYVDGFGDYTTKYNGNYKINLAAAAGAAEYLDLANATVNVDEGLAAKNCEAILTNAGKWAATKSQIQFSFAGSGASGFYEMKNGLIGTITITLLKDLDKNVALELSTGTCVTLRDGANSGNYYYIGTTDVGNVNKNLGATGTKQGIAIASNMGTIAPVSSDVKVTGVTLSDTAKTLDVNDTFTLTAKVAPDNATDTSVTWESSAPAVAKVEDGVVTALTPGKATITVKTADGGFTATCDVTVNEPAKAKVVIRNPHGGALDVNTPAEYQFHSDADGDAVAFIADVTPVGDNTVSKLTWTITSGEKTRDDIVQTLNGAVSGSSISYGLIVTGINAVSAVNAVAE